MMRGSWRRRAAGGGSSDPLTNGLSLHYAFDDNLNDAIGTYSALTFSQSPAAYSLSIKKVGSHAIQLSAAGSPAIDNHLTVPSTNFYDIYDTNTKASVSFWFYSTSSGQRTNQRIISFCDTNKVQMWGDSGGDLNVYRYDTGSFATFTSGAPSISSGNWYHVVITINENGLWNLFLDGVDSELSNFTPTAFANGVTIELGRDCAAGYPLSNMYYDDFRIYDRVLGQGDIDAL